MSKLLTGILIGTTITYIGWDIALHKVVDLVQEIMILFK